VKVEGVSKPADPTATCIREDLDAELPLPCYPGKARAMSLPDDDEHLRALAAEGRVLLAITPDTPPTSWTSWGLD
jgi:hypothetical protein